MSELFELSGHGELINLEALPDACLLLDDQSMIVSCNQPLLALLGYGLNEVILKPVNVLFPRIEDHNQFQVFDFKADDQLMNHSMLGLDKTGQTLGLRIKRSELTLNDKSYLLIRLNTADDSFENQLQEFLAKHPLPVIISDVQKGVILDINTKALKFYGYNKAELIGLPINNLQNHKSERFNENYFTQTEKIKSPSLQDHKLANSEICEVEIYSSFTEGDLSKLISIVIDVSHRFKLDAENNHLSQKYDLLYQQNLNPIWAEDLTPVLLHLNKLRDQGVEDLEKYLQDHPEDTIKMAQSIIVNDVNDAALKLFSASSKTKMKAAITETFGDGALDVFKQELLAIWSGKESFQFPANFISFDGRNIDAIISASLPKSSSLFNDIPVSIIDVSGVKQNERQLEFHSQILSSLSEGVYLISADNGKILYTNPCFEKMFGYDPGEMIGQHVSIVNADEHVDAQKKAQEIIKVLNMVGQWHGEVLNKRKDGSNFWCEASVSTFDHPQFGQVWISVHQDTTEQKNHLQKIWFQANFDYLTQLPNRAHFNEHIDAELKNVEQGGNGFALIFLDLDDFKEVNDTLGHHQGDALLVEVAARLLQCVRSQDVVGRFSGDEFMVLVRDTNENDRNAVEDMAEKILQAIQAPFYISGQNIFMTLSLGIALCPTDSRELTTLIQYADQAMYHAKSLGKNQSSYFRVELQKQALRNQNINRHLREAIELQQIDVFFQPIVECKTGRVHKAEALVRWTHDTLGFVSPAEFIPLAEHSLLIHSLGDYVFHQSVEAVRSIKKHLNIDIQISVNKSPLQFLNNPIHTQKTWPAAIKAAKIPKSAICIEITEGLLLNMEPKVTDRIKTLIANDFSFSIDDFGTGYSALGYLNKIELDYLKIDQSFTQKIDVDEKNLALCEAIIMMAHKLGMKVIAEGVETQSQQNILEKIGCDYCQGYLFSKALPFDQFCQYVEAHN